MSGQVSCSCASGRGVRDCPTHAPSGLTEAERDILLCTGEARCRDGNHGGLCNRVRGVTAMMDDERLVAAVERILADRLAAQVPARDDLTESETLARVAAWFAEAGRNAETHGIEPLAHHGWRLATGWLTRWAETGTAPKLSKS